MKKAQKDGKKIDVGTSAKVVRKAVKIGQVMMVSISVIIRIELNIAICITKFEIFRLRSLLFQVFSNVLRYLSFI